MTSQPRDSVPFSELLRHPAETAERLSRSRALRLRRRDEDDLVLMSADRAEAESEVVELSARILSAVSRLDPEVIPVVLRSALPWVRYLTPNELREFTTEFVETVEASAALDNTAAISLLVTMWRHTAEIHADPDLDRALAADLPGDLGEVPRP